MSIKINRDNSNVKGKKGFPLLSKIFPKYFQKAEKKENPFLLSQERQGPFLDEGSRPDIKNVDPSQLDLDAPLPQFRDEKEVLAGIKSSIKEQISGNNVLQKEWEKVVAKAFRLDPKFRKALGPLLKKTPKILSASKSFAVAALTLISAALAWGPLGLSSYLGSAINVTVTIPLGWVIPLSLKSLLGNALCFSPTLFIGLSLLMRKGKEKNALRQLALLRKNDPLIFSYCLASILRDTPPSLAKKILANPTLKLKSGEKDNTLFWGIIMKIDSGDYETLDELQSLQDQLSSQGERISKQLPGNEKSNSMLDIGKTVFEISRNFYQELLY